MKVYFDLRPLLPGELPPIRDLAREIGITANELRHLLDTNATTVNQTHLNKVCNYLLRRKLVHESDLPGALFSKRYDSFWPLLSERQRIELLTGYRRGSKDWRELVSAADSILQFNVLYQLTDDRRQGRQVRRKSAQRVIDAQLVEAWDFEGNNHDDVKEASRKLFRAFARERGDRALVLFGSVKSNPAIELAIADCFKGAKPFEPEDDVAAPSERSCPLMIRYRKEDPKPKSCCGGSQLSKDQPGTEPGIYYAVELEKPWAHIPSNDRCDGAVVFYRFARQSKELVMVLGGFSGRATRCLAEYLLNAETDRFWPPIISDDGIDVGVFFVKFTFRGSRKKGQPRPANERVSRVDVTPLAKEVLADRLRLAKRKHPHRAASRKKPRALNKNS